MEFLVIVIWQENSGWQRVEREFGDRETANWYANEMSKGKDHMKNLNIRLYELASSII